MPSPESHNPYTHPVSEAHLVRRVDALMGRPALSHAAHAGNPSRFQREAMVDTRRGDYLHSHGQNLRIGPPRVQTTVGSARANQTQSEMTRPHGYVRFGS